MDWEEYWVLLSLVWHFALLLSLLSWCCFRGHLTAHPAALLIPVEIRPHVGAAFAARRRCGLISEHI
jgi:hypothetical protein